jgi:DNA-binding response OmpR family regulator
MRILVIEDDRKMACILQEALEKQLHRVVLTSTGPDGLDVARGHQFEAILLDAMLPGMDGFLVARSLRESKVVTPIVMLTARDAKSDIVKGLDSGVDDYLTKPFAFAELFARIRAVTRRPTTNPPVVLLQIADLSLDPTTHAACRGNRKINLTRTEFLILEFMLRHPCRVLQRDAIINAVWGYEDTVENNTLDVFMKQLRSKIDHGHDTKLIHTVRGFGFQLSE